MSGRKNIACKIFNIQSPASSAKPEKQNRFDLDQIIEGCRRSEEESQERLYKKFYGYALGVALAYCGTRADAVEVVNDSFMKVFKYISSYKRSEPFKPWLRKIVVNTAIDKERSVKKFRQHAGLEEVPSSSPVDIEAELNAHQIYSLLNELSDLLRFVFNLYEIEGYSHKEIAEKLDIAESSSRTYLTRAKNQLRELYRQNFMDQS